MADEGVSSNSSSNSAASGASATGEPCALVPEYISGRGLALLFADELEKDGRFIAQRKAAAAALPSYNFEVVSFNGKNILEDTKRALQSLRGGTSSILIWYMGHGGRADKASGSEGFLWGQEGGSTDVLKLQLLVNDLVPKALPKMFILDCCYSDSTSAPPAPEVSPGSPTPHDIAALRSASPGHFAFASNDHGLTQYVAEVMNGTPPGDCFAWDELKPLIAPRMANFCGGIVEPHQTTLSKRFFFRKSGVIQPIGAVAGHVWLIGSDANLWVRWWDSSSTSWKWSSKGKPPGVANVVAPIGALPSKVMVIGSDQNIWELYWDIGSSAEDKWTWHNHGTPPGVRIQQSVGFVEGYVWLIGSDANLWERWWDSSSTSWKWSSKGKPPGVANVVAPVGALPSKVVVIGSDQNIWELYWDIGSSAEDKWTWHNHGTPPGVRIQQSVGFVEGYVWLIGSDANLWERWWDSSSTSWKWSSSGKPVYSQFEKK